MEPTWTKGKYSTFKREGAKGTKAFCSNCGTGLGTVFEGMPGCAFGVKLGLIKEQNELKPAFHGFMKRKKDWYNVDADKVKQYENWPES